MSVSPEYCGHESTSCYCDEINKVILLEVLREAEYHDFIGLCVRRCYDCDGVLARDGLSRILLDASRELRYKDFTTNLRLRNQDRLASPAEIADGFKRALGIYRAPDALDLDA